MLSKDGEIYYSDDATGNGSSNKSSEYNLQEQQRIQRSPIMNTFLALFQGRKGSLLGCRSCGGGLLLSLGIFFALASPAAAGIEATLIA
jgi:hypothetical protein